MSIKEKIRNYIEESFDMEEILENAVETLMNEGNFDWLIQEKLESKIAKDVNSVIEDYIDEAIEEIIYDSL